MNLTLSTEARHHRVLRLLHDAVIRAGMNETADIISQCTSCFVGQSCVPDDSPKVGWRLHYVDIYVSKLLANTISMETAGFTH